MSDTDGAGVPSDTDGAGVPSDTGRRRRPLGYGRRRRPLGYGTAQASPRIRTAQASPRIRTAQASPRIRPAQASPRIRTAQASPRIRTAQASPRIRTAQASPRKPRCPGSGHVCSPNRDVWSSPSSGARIAASIGRHLVPLFARLAVTPAAPPPSALARQLRLVFEELGGTFIKFGQVIASSPAMFGDEVANESRACLDTGPPEDAEGVRDRLEDDLGMSLHEAFAEFEPDPIGSAHPSRWCTGPGSTTAAKWP